MAITRRRLTPLVLALLSTERHMKAFTSSEVATHMCNKDSRSTSTCAPVTAPSYRV